VSRDAEVDRGSRACRSATDGSLLALLALLVAACPRAPGPPVSPAALLGAEIASTDWLTVTPGQTLDAPARAVHQAFVAVLGAEPPRARYARVHGPRGEELIHASAGTAHANLVGGHDGYRVVRAVVRADVLERLLACVPGEPDRCDDLVMNTVAGVDDETAGGDALLLALLVAEGSDAYPVRAPLDARDPSLVRLLEGKAAPGAGWVTDGGDRTLGFAVTASASEIVIEGTVAVRRAPETQLYHVRLVAAGGQRRSFASALLAVGTAESP
jgi:hypothetical protein